MAPALALLRAGLVLLCLALAACEDADKPYEPSYANEPQAPVTQYIFAPHPLMNAQKLAEVYGALVDRINARLEPEHIRLKLEASLTYAAFNEKLAARKVHFALPNPYQTLLALEHGYVVFGKMDNDEDFRGVILVRRDSKAARVQDLRGATISFAAPTALAATMMPELYFAEHGLVRGKDYTQLFAGTHDSAMLNVCFGASAAACTSPRAWRLFQKERPERARLLAPRWQTPSLPNNGLVALADLPAHVRLKVAQAFFQLGENPGDRLLLDQAGVGRFEPADNAAYAPVQDFVQRYTGAVRALKGLDE
jgi:ABC-type phosphate/phosphonate transport system, periplasmic component